MTAKTPIRIIYRNHRGEVAVRQIRPIRTFYGKSTWHDGEQQFLVADCLENGKRTFAMKDILAWGDARVDAVLALGLFLDASASSQFWDAGITFIRSHLPTKKD